MNFFLIFESSNDYIPFSIVKNENLFSWFLTKITSKNQNKFLMDKKWIDSVTAELKTLDRNIKIVNNVLENLINYRFPEFSNLEDYLDQNFMNKVHCEWVNSQKLSVNLDVLRKSENIKIKELGETLHHLYPDNIREIKLAQILKKLNYIDAYEDINMSIHRLESLLGIEKVEFANNNRYDLIKNEKYNVTEFTNDHTNFSFSYTYLGRQHYDKWLHYDDSLMYNDNYNYEELEIAFHISLGKPESKSFSKEFLDWCNEKKIKPIGCSLAIANILDIQNNLLKYRKIMYNNGRAGNYARLSLTN